MLADGKVVNKIGSEVIAELAYDREVPVYVLANSWKFVDMVSDAYKDKLEQRDPDEVWTIAETHVPRLVASLTSR